MSGIGIGKGSRIWDLRFGSAHADIDEVVLTANATRASHARCALLKMYTQHLERAENKRRRASASGE